MASRSDVASKIASMPKLALKGAVDEEEQKKKDMAAMMPAPSPEDAPQVPVDMASTPEDQSRKSMIAKAILALAPTLIGGALAGNAGAAAGAAEGIKGVSGLTEGEKEKEKERLAKLSLATTKAEKEEQRKLEIAKAAEQIRHNKAEEQIALGKVGSEKSKTLAAEQADKLAGHVASMQQLDDLAAAVVSNADKFGPGAGRIAGLNPYDTTARSLQALTKTAAQNIGKSLEGGKLTDQDILRYEGMLPQLKDTPEVALAKIQQLKRQVATKQASELETFGKAGMNVKNFAALSAPELGVAKQMAKESGRIGMPSVGQEAQAAPAPEYDKMSMEQLMELAKQRGIR